MKRSSLAIAVCAASFGMASGTAMGAGQGERGGYDGAAGANQQRAAQQTIGAEQGHEATMLMGKSVTNDQDQTLGTIENLVIDDSGKVTHVVLADQQDQQWAVPWDRIQISQDADQVTLDISQDQLSSEFSAFESDTATGAGATEDPGPSDVEPGGSIGEEPQSPTQRLPADGTE